MTHFIEELKCYCFIKYFIPAIFVIAYQAKRFVEFSVLHIKIDLHYSIFVQLRSAIRFRGNHKEMLAPALGSLSSLTQTDHDQLNLENAEHTSSETDSGRGSSIDFDDEFKTGTLYWAEFSKSCKWPCLLAPDSSGVSASELKSNYLLSISYCFTLLGIIFRLACVGLTPAICLHLRNLCKKSDSAGKLHVF